MGPGESGSFRLSDHAGRQVTGCIRGFRASIGLEASLRCTDVLFGRQATSLVQRNTVYLIELGPNIDGFSEV
jgi:hypothetical protein